MTKLGTATTKLIMPSSTDGDEAWIEVKGDLYPLDVLDLKDGGSAYDKFCVLAERTIVGWNYTNLNGDPIPPTTEWIDKLPKADKDKLGTYISDLFEKSFGSLDNDEKKTSSAPLTETPPPAPSSPPII